MTLLLLRTTNMENLLIKIYKNRKLSSFLSFFCHAISLTIAIFFFLVIGIQIYREQYLAAIMLSLSSAVGFVLVTLLRRLINAPRPYELYSFYEVLPKKKSGKSFPSRHAYSAFAIATLSFSVSLPLGIALTVLAFLMCASRVLTGIHFIRDVAAGGLIGVLSSVIGLILI